MVVPVLSSHLQRHQESYQRHDSRCRRRDERRSFTLSGLLAISGLGEETSSKGSDRCHPKANPDSEGIEGADISVVTLTGLPWVLVEVEHDGDPRHEEEHEGDPEALYPTLTLSDLEEETEQTEQKGQCVVDIMSLIGGHILWVGRAITVEEGIDEGDPCDRPTT